MFAFKSAMSVVMGLTELPCSSTGVISSVQGSKEPAGTHS